MPARPRRSDCPISVALELLGDPWSLLVIRDLTFKGLHTFRDFMGAGEGIATNVLTDRLARLETAGLIEKAPDPNDGRGRIYSVTGKGLDLAPVLMEIVILSATHEKTAAPPALVRRMKKDRQGLLADLRRAHSRPEGRSAVRPAQPGRIGSKPSGRSVTSSR